MTDIGIGIVGGGYMGKAHAVAFSSVGAVFGTRLRPRLEMVCASTPESAESYRRDFGFARATADWATLVADPKVEAVVIATPSCSASCCSSSARQLPGSDSHTCRLVGREARPCSASRRAAKRWRSASRSR